jgi:hypothetical protein
LYESLKKNTENFHLYIFAFDDRCYDILLKLNLEYSTVISLRDFEDDKLLSIKSTRTKTEYCWTCTPSIILYCIKEFNLQVCTYLDADLYFFSNPNVLIDEMKENSILITEHRYTSIYDQSKYSGIYCVQFMTFKNTFDGLNALNWWRDKCINWCYARCEDGKFGDQKYLDDWPTRFEGVHVLKNLGGGLAPWNIQQYDLENSGLNVIFYHFHNYKIHKNILVDFGNFKINKGLIQRIYKPYTHHLIEISIKLSKEFNEIIFHNEKVISVNLRQFHSINGFNLLKRFIKGVYNVYQIKNL